MRLIIDIPEDVRNKIIEIYNSCEELHTRGNLYQAIVNGKPYEERPQGEWIDHQGLFFECTICKHKTAFGGNYCPNCGADMRQEADNEICNT